MGYHPACWPVRVQLVLAQAVALMVWLFTYGVRALSQVKLFGSVLPVLMLHA